MSQAPGELTGMDASSRDRGHTTAGCHPLCLQVQELTLEEFTLGEAQPTIRDIWVHRCGEV